MAFCTRGNSRGIRGCFRWAFVGHSRAFAGIRASHASMRLPPPPCTHHDFASVLQPITSSGLPQNRRHTKPKVPVEQTCYIILIEKIDLGAALAASAWLHALLRILPRVGRPLSRSVGRSAGGLLGRLVDRSVGRPFARSAARSLGRPVGRSIGRSVDPGSISCWK